VKTDGTAVTPGQVNFCDASAKYCTDIHLLGTAQLTSAGTSTLKFHPGIGSHSYKAVFIGTNSKAGSSSAASALTVTGIFPTITTITQSGGAGNYTLTAMVSGLADTPSAATPTGTVSFRDTTNGNAVLATAALGAGTAGLSFFDSSSPTVGLESNVALAADFNGDGIPDLAVSGQNSLAIILGNGDGTFTATATSPTVDSNPNAIAVGDFNGDGKPDLAVTSSDYSTVNILLGNGDGTFTPAPDLATGTTPQSVTVGDFNGDGNPDLAIVNASQVLVFLGDGTGVFAETTPTQLAGNLPSGAAMGDFNGDGIADLAVANYCGSGPTCNNAAGSITILLGKGDGTFTLVSATPATSASPIDLAVADFNGDGILDLAVSDRSVYGGAADILLGNGDGTFKTAISYSASGFYFEGISVADFNADGIPDLVVGETNDGAAAFLAGKGDGTLAAAVTAAANAPSSSGYLATADFNGDGIPDIAMPSQTGQVAILLTQLTQSATATVTGISPTGPGVHQVNASYPGNNSYIPSVSGVTALTPVVATPLILPASGPITSAASITITEATPGATIYYEASGAVTTSGFVQYTSPIPLEGNGTLNIQAYATDTGYQQSGYTAASYTLKFAAAAASPVISLASGRYASTQTVTISDSTPGATIYYSTNGSYPYTYSNVYSGPITVSTSEIVTAVALAPGYSVSGYAIAQYYIGSSSTRFIYTIAGNQTFGSTGDGGPATFAEMHIPQGVAVDSAGNIYVSDSTSNIVRKITAGTGIITTIAGTGIAGHTGDGGPAAGAELWYPNALAVDGSGDLFIAESWDTVVRRVDGKTGTITTFAGSPGGAGNIGGPAADFALYSVNGLACDHLGNLYIAEYGDVVEVNAGTGNISEVAGYSTNAGFDSLSGIAVDASQNIYVSDTSDSVVRKIAPGGAVTVFAGSSNGPYGGDGGPATNSRLYYPAGLAVDAAGDIYIADSLDSAIREVNTSGIINTIAGILLDPYTDGADGSPATDVGLEYPQAIASDAAGNIYLADQAGYRIRKITVPSAPPNSAAAMPVLSLRTGTYPDSQTLTMTDSTPGAEIYVSLNGIAPTTASQGYHGPINVSGSAMIQAIALAPGYLTSAPVSATYTITAPPAALIYTVAGSGKPGFQNVEGPAADATLGEPEAIAFNSKGDLYVADQLNNVVWMVAANTGNTSVVAGTGTTGEGGDGGPATAAELIAPQGVAIDKAGNLYIADSDNGRIRMVAAQTGVITTIAGPGSSNNLGDGGPATSADVNPYGMAFDSAGNLYFADVNHNRIRMISAATGDISTVAGGGTTGQLGDGGLATAATLNEPFDVKLDSAGNLYISDYGNARIRKVAAGTGLISTIAGNGVFGDTGDGSPATVAQIDNPAGIAVDGAGNVYLSNDTDSLRKVDAKTGTISTIAGSSYVGFGGDGGAATMAELYDPLGMALDAKGNLYFSDEGNGRVREVIFTASAVAPTITVTPSASRITTLQSLSVTIAVSGGSSNPVPTGSVILTGGGYTSAITALSSGDSTITIPAGALAIGSDTLNVAYSPDEASVGQYTAASQSVSGTEVVPPAPLVGLSASSVAFGNQSIGTESDAQVVTLTNTGQAPLTISSIALTGANASQFIYGTTTSCTTVAVNGTCTFRIRFNPTVAGAASAAISITDNAAGSPHAIALTGTGVGTPAVSLSSKTAAFGTQAVNTESAAQVVTLTNTGTGSLSISGIALTGANASQFIYGTTAACTTIDVNGTCTFRVRFNPTVAGAANAAITITDSAAASPQSIALTGTGVGTPAVSLSSKTAAFGTEAVNTESAAQVVTLTNTGTGSLSITSIALTGTNTSQFIYGTTAACTTIAVNGTCTFRIRFNPTVAGAANAAITITDNAAGSPHAIALTGTGVGTPAVSLSSKTAAFGTQAVNTESAAQVVTLTNTGTGSLSITSIALTGTNTSQFIYGTTAACTTIAVNGTCTFRIRFNPTVAGGASAAITITDNAAASPQSIALTGTGVGTPAVSLSATTVAFGTEAINTESAAQVVTLTNTGTGSLSISGIALTGANASQFIYGTTTSCTTIAVNGTCTFRVRFNPTVTGAASAAITITDNAAVSPQSIALTGTGQ
jgi:sugar lactone lactonase YvrE